MRLAFIAGKNSTVMHGQFDADRLFEHRALTGSESSFFNVARGLSALGHTVNVYCDVVKSVESCAKLSGARVVPLEYLPDESKGFDAYVSLNEPDQFRDLPQSGLKIVQHQYNDFLNSRAGYDEFVDAYAFLSPVHRDQLARTANLDRAKVLWIPNSIDVRMNAATLTPDRDAHTAVWCSSPDRGLHRLLEMWPNVRKAIPDAKLKIFYRFWEWIDECKEGISKLSVRARYISECIRRLGSKGENGVHVMGPVPNVQMLAELRAARVFPYTCDTITFTEGFSVATMDAAWSGCVPIISNVDAIGDIYNDVAIVIDGKFQDTKTTWVDTIVRAMSDSRWADEVSAKAKRWSMEFDVEKVAGLWETFLLANVGKKATIDSSMLPRTIRDFVALGKVAKEGDQPVVNPAADVSPVAVPKAENRSIVHRFECVSDRLRIAIILGKMSHAVHGIFNPDDIYERGQAMTGTGSNFFNLAWGLAERGHMVDAFTETTVPHSELKRFAGVHLYNLDSNVISDDYQCYVTVNEPDMVRSFPAERLKICQMQLNDFGYTRGGFDEFIDCYVCPSDRHARYLAETTGIERKKLFMIPLSINAEFFDCDDVERDPFRITYCSSPDRGLHNLLEIFPTIRKEIPKATLHVYYRLRPWLDSVLHVKGVDPVMRSRAEVVFNAIQKLGSNGENGLHVHGPVPTKVMARELLASKILAYPCDPVRFTEGFSISIMDACAASCVPIISDVDALPDVYTGVAKIIPGKPSEKKEEWTKAIIYALRNDARSDEVRYNAKAFSAGYTRQKIAKLWESFIREQLAT